MLRERGAKAVTLDDRPRQTLGASPAGVLVPVVEVPTGELAAARQADPQDSPASDEGVAENADLGVGEDLGEVDQLHAEAQVGAVGAEATQGLGILQAREGCGDLL